MNIIKKIFRNESGFILPTALVLMILGGLLVVPSLYLMQTTLKSGQVVDVKTRGIYAADAGIEDALWNYMQGDDPFASSNTYTIAEDINGMAVTVNKTDEQPYGTGTLYTVVSVARLNGQEKARITAKPLVGGDINLAWLFDSAITSAGNVDLSNNVTVSGNVTYGGDLTTSNHVVINGEENPDDTLESSWPTCDQMKSFYLPQVAGAPDPGSYPSLSTNPDNPTLIGPWYRDGNLTLRNNGCASLEGTIYVKGNFTAENNVTLNLNGETIFAEGEISLINNLVLRGPGCLIACGDVTLENNVSQGYQLIGGVTDEAGTTASGTVPGGRFIMSKLKASNTGTMSCFHVYCTGPGHVKLAIYNASGGFLNSVGDNITGLEVQSGWNTFDFPDTSITKKTDYWLAANSDTAVIGNINKSSVQKWKPLAFSSVFPSPAGTVPNNDNAVQYILTGWSDGQELIFIMSLGGSVTVSNNVNFYGCLAAYETVTMNNNSEAILVQVPETGLNFPMSDGAGGGDDGDFTVQLLTYSVQ